MSSRLSIPLLGSYLQQNRNRLIFMSAVRTGFSSRQVLPPSVWTQFPSLHVELNLDWLPPPCSSFLQDQVPSSFSQLFRKLKYPAQGIEQFPRSQSPEEKISVPLLFHFSRINHIDDIINGDRCFCNVCRDDDFGYSCRRPEEHKLLLFTRQ